MDIQLGYKLFVEPTIWNVWTMWRFDIIFGTLAILLAVAYMWGVRRLRLRGEPWPWYRTAWFMSGCMMLLVTMCSGRPGVLGAGRPVHPVARRDQPRSAGPTGSA